MKAKQLDKQIFETLISRCIRRSLICIS